MITVDRWGLSCPDICLTVEGKPRKKTQPGKLTLPVIEPGPAGPEATMLPLDHSGGHHFMNCLFCYGENRTHNLLILKKINPWRYLPEEPRSIEVVAARWQYRGALWLAKRLSLNFNFSFLNRISLFLSSRYPIVLTRLGGSRSRRYTSRKIIRV